MQALNLLGNIQLGPGLADVDWVIIGLFLGLTTVVAFVVKGRQTSVRAFFLSDRNLPWVAVCLSLIATEISAASFAGVPYLSFSGSLTYLQLAVGVIIARVLIGFYMVPQFYEREYFSPYHFVGARLGIGAERTTRALFIIGAVLGQAVRVFIVAFALYVIAGVPAHKTILIITVFAALWAALGGIRSVVWTDVLQFFVLMAAALAVGFYVVSQTTGGWEEVFKVASARGKLRIFDFRVDHMLEFTIWTGLFGSTFNSLASHGADHMNTQRLFSCRSAGDARRAILWSSLSQVAVVVLAFVGLALFAYYQQHADALNEHTFGVSRKHILAIFIATTMPPGLKGLMVIGLLAAAISSLSSALAALAQTTTRSLYTYPEGGTDRNDAAQVRLARVFTLGWGVLLALMALYFNSMVLDFVVTSALKTTSFTYGALLGSVLYAFLPLQRDGRGVFFAASLAVLAAFGMAVHDIWTHWIVVFGVVFVLACWFYVIFREVDEMRAIKDHQQYVRRAWYILLAELPRTVWVLAGMALVLYVHFGTFYTASGDIKGQEVAWPWYLPMGTGLTVLLSYLLSRPKNGAVAESSEG